MTIDIVVVGTVLYDFVQLPYTDIFAAKYAKKLDDQVRCAKLISSQGKA